MSQISLVGTPAESSCHKSLKLLLYNQLYKHNAMIVERAMEKYLGNRFADVYFKFQDGKQVVVEVQNSPISVNEIMQRTSDYNNLGIFVLWILHGNGNTVGAPKSPMNAKEIKISLAEHYLHRIYGGRVYYINLYQKKGKLKDFELFALHFIKPFEKKKRELFKGRYTHYYLRDVLCIQIENSKILCNEFARNNIARFYDKNIKSVVKKEIKDFFNLQIKNGIVEKKVIKIIKKRFVKSYGRYLIYKSIAELSQSKQITLSEKCQSKISKSVS